jgi:4-hydroxyphenylpyruvate dioxygenase
MKPCLSQAATLPTPFAADVVAFAAAGFRGMEVWLTKLESHLERHPADETRRLLVDHGMALAAASYQGGLLLSQGEARKAHFDHFRRRLELCQVLGIPTLVLVADFAQAIDATALQRAVVSLAQAGQWAAAFDVRLALEFRGTEAFCSSLDTAVALVAQCGQPNVGVCLDAFHFYKGPSKPEDLELLTRENLAFVQLCDVAGVPRELMTDSDRIFPGEGDFRTEILVNALRRINYEGWVSLELMNPTLWKANPEQVAELGLAALRRVIGV